LAELPVGGRILLPPVAEVKILNGHRDVVPRGVSGRGLLPSSALQWL
jgi:hypothetical protein